MGFFSVLLNFTPKPKPSFTELMPELMKRLLRAYAGFRIYSVS